MLVAQLVILFMGCFLLSVNAQVGALDLDPLNYIDAAWHELEGTHDS